MANCVVKRQMKEDMVKRVRNVRVEIIWLHCKKEYCIEESRYDNAHPVQFWKEIQVLRTKRTIFSVFVLTYPQNEQQGLLFIEMLHLHPLIITTKK